MDKSSDLTELIVNELVQVLIKYNCTVQEANDYLYDVRKKIANSSVNV